MEIGSMDSMSSLMGMMGGAQGTQPPPPPDASQASSDFINALDSDGDGALSQTEFSAGSSSGSSESSEVFDVLDTNEDGFVSQEELEADMQSKLETMKSQLQFGGMSGIQQSGDTDQFNQLMEMMNNNSDSDKSRGAEAYGRMQQGAFAGGNSGQSLSSGLNLTA